jgi:hypothetical protein
MQKNHDLSRMALCHITQLAEQLNFAYRETIPERKEINEWEWDNELDFSILGVIDLYTSYIDGYASQITTKGRVKEAQKAANHLQTIQFFDEAYFADWYFSPDNQYVKVKAYVEFLNHLRLCLLEYVTHHQNGANVTTTDAPFHLPSMSPTITTTLQPANSRQLEMV